MKAALLRIRPFAMLFALFVSALFSGMPVLAQSPIMTNSPVMTNSVVDNSTEIDLPRIIDVLEDERGTLSIQDVTSPLVQKQFQPLGQGNPYLGFQNSAWWGRFTLTNPSDEALTLILELALPVMDRIELYQPDALSGDEHVMVRGDSVLQKDGRDVRGPLPSFRLQIPAGESKTYYLRLSGKSALSPEWSDMGADSFIDNKAMSLDGNFLFFGVLLATSFFCLFLFLLLRDQSYLLFAMAMLAVGVHHAEARGYLSAYLWPPSTWISNFVVVLSVSFTLSALARFTARFLNLAFNAPYANTIFKGLQAVGPVAVVLSFIDYHIASHVLILGMVLGNLLALAVSVFLWSKGIVYARLYVVCWAIFCGFAVVIGAAKLGLVYIGQDVDVIFRFAISISIILIASAFFDRFRILSEANQRRYKKARDEAIAASRAKSIFLATMSHELRTPLNAVIGFSEILANDAAGKAGRQKAHEYALNILEAGKHLLRMINNLLMLSRIEAGHVDLEEKIVELPELLRRCARIVQDRADADEVTLKADLDASLPMLYCDEKLIQDVLVNLLQNAVKFTPMGGHVGLQARMDVDDMLVISVSDTGIGIAQEDIKRIHEPFTQVGSHLTRQHGGLGLGLAIATAILGLHKGEFLIESEVGEGSIFMVRFPAERLVKVA